MRIWPIRSSFIFTQSGITSFRWQKGPLSMCFRWRQGQLLVCISYGHGRLAALLKAEQAIRIFFSIPPDISNPSFSISISAP